MTYFLLPLSFTTSQQTSCLHLLAEITQLNLPSLGSENPNVFLSTELKAHVNDRKAVSGWVQRSSKGRATQGATPEKTRVPSPYNARCCTCPTRQLCFPMLCSLSDHHCIWLLSSQTWMPCSTTGRKTKGEIKQGQRKGPVFSTSWLSGVGAHFCLEFHLHGKQLMSSCFSTLGHQDSNGYHVCNRKLLNKQTHQFKNWCLQNWEDYREEFSNTKTGKEKKKYNPTLCCKWALEITETWTQMAWAGIQTKQISLDKEHSQITH